MFKRFYCKACGYTQFGEDCDEMECDRCGCCDWSPISTPPLTDCQDCRGHGYLHVIGAQARIERCDACERFKTDNEAIEHVIKLAWATEGV